MKKKIAVIAILVGALILIVQLALKSKGYYVQSVGILLLMGGLFLINTSIPSSTSNVEKDKIEKDTSESYEDRG
ncbi:hypothetical protein NBT05_11255 [Aquimarina sp. ERC-38]|uniref:hypothetical protein n=1 Tax=Aquimarina sp. ERC-38 TaxID=2949996 RepID=UPI002247578C|nr:hypothetical protein [Aquimarina sp. ERC-38]UZO79536.1 hypothetical protein NBT05_11255 [Aquimarina sp. ERC-38]